MESHTPVVAHWAGLLKISSVMGCHVIGDSSATVPAWDIFALFEATAFVVVTRHEQARGLVVGDLQIKVACMHRGSYVTQRHNGI